MIISYYGDGKGKTTAALGLVLRASGYKKKILFAQFIKGEFKTGEDEALKEIKGLARKKFGLGFVGIGGDTKRPDEHKAAAQKGLKYVSKNLDNFEVIVLDEIFGAVKGKLLCSEDVLKLLAKSKEIDFVLTGRPKIDELLAVSDLVSEIKKVKHPFDNGLTAKRGIDY